MGQQHQQQQERYEKNNGPLGRVPEVSVGASDRLLLVVSGIGFVFLAWTVYSIILTKVKSARELRDDEGRGGELGYDQRLAQADVSTLNRAQRRARARHIMKQQRRADGGAGAAAEDLGDDGHDADGHRGLAIAGAAVDPAGRELPPPPEQDVPPFQDETHHRGSLRHTSRRDRQRAAKEVEREERRLLEEDRRREQAEAQESARLMKRERERLSAAQTEEGRRLRKAEREAQEWEEYQSWRTFLPSPSPSSDGAAHEMGRPPALSVKGWIRELKQRRVASLGDLSERFHVSPDVVRTRIEELLDSSRVSGILDADNDRFIYLSPQTELPTLASFVKSQGMVTPNDVRRRIQEMIVCDRIA